MARNRPPQFIPMLRSRARYGVRIGRSKSEIIDSILDEFPTIATGEAVTRPGTVTRIVNDEFRRQSVIDRIQAMDKRRRTNLHTLVGCGAGKTIRSRITITFPDPHTGEQKTFGHTTTLKNQGRLMDILNSAIQDVINVAGSRGYTLPQITSSMTGGKAFYRLEYVECV